MKRAEDVPNNIFVQVSNKFVEFRSCYSQIYPKMSLKNLYFLYKSEQNCSYFQPKGLMLISIKTQFRTIIYSPINLHTGVNFFFWSLKNFKLEFLKTSFQLSNFKMLQLAVELSFWKDFFFFYAFIRSLSLRRAFSGCLFNIGSAISVWYYEWATLLQEEARRGW